MLEETNGQMAGITLRKLAQTALAQGLTYSTVQEAERAICQKASKEEVLTV